LDVLRPLFGLDLAGARAGVAALDEARAKDAVPAEAYLLALLLGQEEGDAAAHVESFNWPRRVLASRERLLRLLDAPQEVTDDELEQLTPAEAALLRSRGGALAERIVRLAEEPPRRRLRGRDVVALGLPEGPAVGRVLADVERARAQRQTTSFEDELELARRLVDELRRPERP